MIDSSPITSIDVLQTSAIDPATWDEIWNLTHQFYETDRDYVERKLKEHQRTVLFRSHDERTLIGVVSMDIYPIEFRSRKLAIIYTSHVLLQEKYRGQNLIQKLGFRSFLEARLRFPWRSIYWFFDTFSYKSYLLLPRNFRHFWPRVDRKTPEWERSLMHQLASRTYGSAWQPSQGIVTRSGRKRLRPHVAPLEHRPAQSSPHLEFFARANPRHADGDMLVCLCPLTAANWMDVGMRAIRRSHKI